VSLRRDHGTMGTPGNEPMSRRIPSLPSPNNMILLPKHFGSNGGPASYWIWPENHSRLYTDRNPRFIQSQAG